MISIFYCLFLKEYRIYFVSSARYHTRVGMPPRRSASDLDLTTLKSCQIFFAPLRVGMPPRRSAVLLGLPVLTSSATNKSLNLMALRLYIKLS